MTTNITGRTKQQTFILILILGILNTITPFSIDMYLPAFPQIAKDLRTTLGDVSLSVSTYFLGFALGQIIYGPLLDRFGRKPPLYIGLSLYVIASIVCALSQTIDALLIARFFQAISGCVATVAAMAMVRDFFPPDKGSSIISFLVLILGLSPLLAPTTGSLVMSVLSWRWIFIVLASIALIMLFVTIFFLQEGHKADKSISLKPKPIITGFANILTEKRFYIFSLAGTFSFAGLFVYVAGSPSIFMDEFNVSVKAYGGIFALLSVGFIGGSQMNHLLSRKFMNDQIFKTVLIIQVVASISYFIGVYYVGLGLIAHLIFLFITLSCAGLTYPNAAAIALSPFSKNAGSASALLGFIQIGIGGLISSGIGLLHTKGSFSTALIMAITSSVALIILLAGRVRITDEMREEIKLAAKTEVM